MTAAILLMTISQTDQLTGSFNRRGLNDAAALALASPRALVAA